MLSFRFALCLGCVLTATLGLCLPAQGHDRNRLFPGDRLVITPRFSDEIVGHGPDVVFIPGLASSRATWKAVAAKLKKSYRLHLIQIAGFAGEPPRANVKGPILLATAQALDAYLRAQHLTPATLIGHSLGGTIVLYLAEHDGHDLSHVMVVDALPFAGVLVGQTTLKGALPIARAMRSHPAPLPGADAARMMATMAISPSNQDRIARWSRRSDPSTVANAFADDITLDLTPDLGLIRTPVMLVFPDYTPLGIARGKTRARYLHAFAGLKTLTAVEIHRSLHFVMFDRPRRFAAVLMQFLSQKRFPH